MNGFMSHFEKKMFSLKIYLLDVNGSNFSENQSESNSLGKEYFNTRKCNIGIESS